MEVSTHWSNSEAPVSCFSTDDVGGGAAEPLFVEKGGSGSAALLHTCHAPGTVGSSHMTLSSNHSDGRL